MIIRGFDTDKDVFVIAEIGNNHEGDFDVATQLVKKAAETGVDAVKFQTFKTEFFVSAADKARFERLKSFELAYPQFEKLADLAKSLGLAFISTPLDLASADFLSTIVDCFKIASSDNNFHPLIDRVASYGKPLIISGGLAGIDELRATVEFVTSKYPAYKGSELFAVLHCVSCYPVPPNEANLRSVQFLSQRFRCTVGYSDHTTGIDAAPLAVALGARIVEKHFTLDKAFSDFRDHQLSADPHDMKELVRRVRAANRMLGTREKVVQPCEQAGAVWRRSIAAARNLRAGHKLTASDLTWIRPAGGLSPGDENVILSRILKRDVAFGEQILATDVD